MLEEALDLVRAMPMRPDSYVHGARPPRARPAGGGVHVQLSNMYAGSSNWDGVLKLPGCSVIQVNGVAGDRSHPHMREIIATVTGLNAHLRLFAHDER
jgi:hypothetical protein